jgi:hypothetical protein
LIKRLEVSDVEETKKIHEGFHPLRKFVVKHLR